MAQKLDAYITTSRDRSIAEKHLRLTSNKIQNFPKIRESQITGCWDNRIYKGINLAFLSMTRGAELLIQCH